MKRHCLALDLKNDPTLIDEYINYHKNIWPEIEASIKVAGIISMEIYNVGNRLFMIMEVDESFSFDKKSEMDHKNQKVQEWEDLMWNYQQALPMSNPGEKWIKMNKIFDLK